MDPSTALRPLATAARYFPWLLRRVVFPLWYKIKRGLRPTRHKISILGFKWEPILGFKIRTSWGEIKHYLLTIESDFAKLGITLAIGTGVGGGILAALVIGNLAQPNAVVCVTDRQEKYVDGKREAQLRALPSEREMSELVTGKIVVAVAAELVSGQTTKLLMEEIGRYKPARIFTLCIDWHEGSEVMPDFYHNYIASGAAATKNRYKIIQKPWRISPSYLSGDAKQRPS